MSSVEQIPALRYYKIHKDARPLTRGSQNAACYDVRAYFSPEGFGSREIGVYTKDNVKVNYVAFQEKLEDPIKTILNPGDRALIPTGLILDIPVGHSVRVHPRSGLSLKSGLALANCEGVIDNDYIDPLFILIINNSSKQISIFDGDRVAQLEMVRDIAYDVLETNSPPGQKTDRNGGFGSTGVR
jgi:dUTP pyrophosphatase